MKKILATVLFVLGFSLCAEETSLQELINPDYIEQLQAEGHVIIIHDKKNNFVEIAPKCDYAEQIKGNLLSTSSKGVGFLGEFLYLIPKSQLTDEVEKVNIDSLCTIFRSVNKMEGMKYIHNGGKVDTLYKKSYTIENPSSFEKIPDLLDGPTDGLVSYSYQVDNTFGDTKYKLNYYQKDNVVFLTLLNQIPMTKFGVKAVQFECLRTNVMAFDLSEYVLLYLCADVNAKNILGVHSQIEDSMTCRMEALYQWFITQYK